MLPGHPRCTPLLMKAGFSTALQGNQQVASPHTLLIGPFSGAKWRPQFVWGPGFRWFQSRRDTDEDHLVEDALDKQKSVADIFQSLNALSLKEALEQAAETKYYITHDELLEMIKESGAAKQVEDIEDLADALNKSGVILQYNDLVYLRPAEVAELVVQHLPGTSKKAKQRLEEIERELTILELQHDEIQRASTKWPDRFLKLGCLVLFTQLVTFIYLTWWELSWDVMEPYGYILSLFYSLLAYLYFFLTRGSYLDYGPFREYWTQRTKEKHLVMKGFDMERFQKLQKARDRYQRMLRRELTQNMVAS